MWREEYREGIASRGLKLLHTLTSTEDHEAVVLLMQKELMWKCGPSFEDATSEEIRPIGARGQQHPDDDQTWSALLMPAKLPFSGDTESAPPLSWVILCRGRDENYVDGIVPKELKTWGHVFWDLRRLVSSGGKQAVQQALWRRDV